MEKTEKFRMRRNSKKTATNTYAASMRGVNKTVCPTGTCICYGGEGLLAV